MLLADSVVDMDAWVIGGVKLYCEAINHPNCSEIWVTEIEGDYECDRFFPELEGWTEEVIVPWTEENGMRWRRLKYT